jgi:hypothetical protein
MWPFNKRLDTGCASGFFQHDDKHHLWGRWEEWIENGTIAFPKLNVSYPYQKRIQKRSCEICGFIEQKDVKTDGD